ncbi:MAG: hypothetical protein MUC35_05930 [Candidatus Margulisbacteria bacterium]|jgi:hypothetical protein|nr:hypothetical protein [Candidatus Margulisiibacteriota bacterium]
MNMNINGSYGFGSLANSAQAMALQIDNVGAEVSRIIRDYNQKTNEEVSQGNKIAETKLREQTMQRLGQLEKQLRQIPPTLQARANKVLAAIEQAKDQLGGLGAS